MKIVLDNRGRKMYKFSHSVHQGGYFYCHKSIGKINNKDGLRNVLNAVTAKLSLIDVTIKIYDDIFFFFFMMKPLVEPKQIIEIIQKNISCFGEWNKEYLYNAVYDLQEKYLRKDLEKWGYDYNEE